MKKLVFGLITVILSSCVGNAQFDGTKTKNTIKFENAFDLPIGSSVIFDEAKEIFTFELQEDYLLVGIDESGYLKVGNSGTVNCKCIKGSGCNPFVAEPPVGGSQAVGCTSTACEVCTMKTSVSFMEHLIEISKPGIIDKTEKIHFITEKEELLSLNNPNEKMFEDSWFMEEIINFVKGYQVNNIEEMKNAKNIEELENLGYINMPVSVYGYLIYLPIEKDLIMSSNLGFNSALKYMMQLADDVGRSTCACESGSSGCTKKTKNTVICGSVVYCEAGACKNCTLSY
jgi:hypothetical protein